MFKLVHAPGACDYSQTLRVSHFDLAFLQSVVVLNNSLTTSINSLVKGVGDNILQAEMLIFVLDGAKKSAMIQISIHSVFGRRTFFCVF